MSLRGTLSESEGDVAIRNTLRETDSHACLAQAQNDRTNPLPYPLEEVWK